MALLYGRHVSVNVAGLLIEEPHISVTVERQGDQSQTKSSISIFNLREDRESRIESRRGAPILVSAGYEDRVDQILDGVIQHVAIERNQLTSLTRIEAGDQLRSATVLGGDTERSYEGVQTVRQIVTDIVTEDMGLEVGPLDAIPASATEEDWFASLSSGSALNILLAPLDLVWFEADGVIRISGVGMTQPDAPNVTIHAPTEIVRRATPKVDGDEMTDAAEITLFLRPEIVVGATLNIRESQTFGGAWKVAGLRHTADNWDGDFVTWCDLRRL